MSSQSDTAPSNHQAAAGGPPSGPRLHAPAGAAPAPETSPPAAAPEPLLIGLRELARLLGVSKATAERMKAAGRLPRPLELSSGCHRWRLSEVRQWVEAGAPPRREWEARTRGR
jgi:predicted DNA-binding transcriptional regulator AlpA